MMRSLPTIRLGTSAKPRSYATAQTCGARSNRRWLPGTNADLLGADPKRGKRGKRGKGLPRFRWVPDRAWSARCLLTLASHEPLLLQRGQHLVQTGG